MKRKNLRDIIIACFLISTLGVATFIVSCSEQDIVNINSSDISSGYQQHVHSQNRGIFTSLLPGLFANIAAGADNQIGSVGMGWLFGAMGITNNSSGSPNYQNQFNKIFDDLNAINNTLDQTNNELNTISSFLAASNCNFESSQLSDEINIISSYLTRYNNLVDASVEDSLPISDSCTAPNDCMVSLTNDILSNGSNSLLLALIGIQNNLSSVSGTAISSCIDTSLAYAVGYTGKSGTFKMDSVYYSFAHRVLYQYYYWQTIGLGLYSEASHYLAWQNAVSLGDTNISSDSAQLICSINNSFINQACLQVRNESNTVYNSILPQFQLVGASYTGSDLIYQRNIYGEDVVWVKSLEDFTSQSGANCNLTEPLSLFTPANVCGPTVGKVGSTLSFTTYYGTQDFTFPGFHELNGLVTPYPSGVSVPQYFENLGFENMQYKVLIADSLIKIDSNNVENQGQQIDTMTVVPFILGFGHPWNNGGASKVIYTVAYDFIGYHGWNIMNLLSSEALAPSSCDGMPSTNWSWKWAANIPSATTLPLWAGASNNEVSGTLVLCGYIGLTNFNSTLVPFTWNSTSVAPGWSYYSKNSNPQPAFFIPVRKNFSGTSGCVTPSGGTPYPNHTRAPNTGVITMCGADFQNYININIQRPPTCNISPTACLNY